MDTNTTKSDWYLVIMIFLNGARLIYQLHTLKKQLQKNPDMKENLDTSSPVTILIKLDRYVSELLHNYKKRY